MQRTHASAITWHLSCPVSLSLPFLLSLLKIYLTAYKIVKQALHALHQWEKNKSEIGDDIVKCLTRSKGCRSHPGCPGACSGTNKHLLEVETSQSYNVQTKTKVQVTKSSLSKITYKTHRSLCHNTHVTTTSQGENYQEIKRIASGKHRKLTETVRAVWSMTLRQVQV